MVAEELRSKAIRRKKGGFYKSLVVDFQRIQNTRSLEDADSALILIFLSGLKKSERP